MFFSWLLYCKVKAKIARKKEHIKKYGLFWGLFVVLKFENGNYEKHVEIITIVSSPQNLKVKIKDYLSNKLDKTGEGFQLWTK